MIWGQKPKAIGSTRINRIALAGVAAIGTVFVAGVDTATAAYRPAFRVPVYRPAPVYRAPVYNMPAYRPFIAPVMRPMSRPIVAPVIRPAARPIIQAPYRAPTPHLVQPAVRPFASQAPTVSSNSMGQFAAAPTGVSRPVSPPMVSRPNLAPAPAPSVTMTRPTGATMPTHSVTPGFSVSSPSAMQATAAQPIAPVTWSNKTTTPATPQNAPRIPAPLVQGVSSAADATQLGVKVLESWKKNPISQATLEKVDRTAGGVSAVTSGIGAYQAYQSGDRLGTGINAAQAVAGGTSALAGSGASATIRNGAPLVATVGSMAKSAQSLGTALGTGNRWNLDKGIAVSAATTEFVGKGAAAGAGYLIGGAAGANTAISAADLALGAGKWAGDKFTDTQVFKQATDRWLHTSTNEARAVEYDRQIEATRAQRIINGR